MDDKASILIVDDYISQFRTMSLILKRKGYTVVTARDGREAIERISQRDFSIVFMDIKMPSLNGVETYKIIKKIRPGANVMMMTAHAVEDLVQEALREGARGIIYKPLDMAEVVAVIEGVGENIECKEK